MSMELLDEIAGRLQAEGDLEAAEAIGWLRSEIERLKENGWDERKYGRDR